ncbi:MAG TPA: exopolysaccharide Pel transporter PelG [Burkholderiaceae bacterium]|nr:exopolysaccharide Pel transporter PelG [Burkholderiaceae bacterium]
MAGIGFALRKLTRRNTLTGLFQAYAYAGIISSGPWILSILGILVIGLMSATVVVPQVLITHFQVSVTYLIACSLILTGLVQLAFTRFVADRTFEKRESLILPNFVAITLVVTVVGGVVGMFVVLVLFRGLALYYRLMMLAGFVILCNIWITTIFLSSIKQYRAVVLLYLGGYTVSVVAALALRGQGLHGLLTGFVIGQAVLLVGSVAIILRNYPPSDRLMSFEVLDKKLIFPSLIWTGLFYNLGVWIDKFMFWFRDETGHAVIGPLRASLIYDLPIFLAYLSIIPGMAIFLVRLETDFVEHYDAFYTAVREGGSLGVIEQHRNGMVESVRLGLFDIVKVQTVTTLVLLLVGPALLRAMGITDLYLPLLLIDTIGAGLQVVLLGLMNVFFYLDKRAIVLSLTALFCVLNVVFTAMTLMLGPSWYGYGFTVAVLVTIVVGLAILDRKLDRLEYETFMLQH